MSRPDEIGRLALRVEGNKWVAYYAFSDTMRDAVWLGSIAMGAVADEGRKQAFMAIMQDVVSDFIEDATGQRPDWNDPKPAPEHERAGRA